MNANFNALVSKFVRNRESLTEAESERLLGENIKETIRAIGALKRDIEVQFVAHEARLADMSAKCARAAMSDSLVSVQTGDDREEDPTFEDLPPQIALDLFTARELRWKVRTTRFLHLIDDALADAIECDTTGVLISAIEKHRHETAEIEEEYDNDLYAVVDRVKQSMTT